MNSYSIREFRTNIKEALDKVEKGERVHIQRGNKTFELICTTFGVHKTSGVHTKDESGVHTDPAIIDGKALADTEEILVDAEAYKQEWRGLKKERLPNGNYLDQYGREFVPVYKMHGLKKEEALGVLTKKG